ITGDDGNDVLVGGALGDTLNGNAGADVLLGDSAQLVYALGDLRTITSIGSALGAIDTIFGDEGNDIIAGGAAADILHGNAGNDLIFGDEAEIHVANLVLQEAQSLNYGVGGIDTIFGDAGEDIIAGGAAGDFLHGGSGNDLVFGDESEIHVVNLVVQQAFSVNVDKGGVDVITGDDDN